ncbi:galactose mutarotase-like domain-containing protein [Dichotomocladium elegans]|nr:galactose mutarotase-like domain-containing protein [Dichotomocladium elegans]
MRKRHITQARNHIYIYILYKDKNPPFLVLYLGEYKTMLIRSTFALVVTAMLAHAWPSKGNDAFKKHTIKAKGIEASFIEYGATITNLWVEDKDGIPRDVVIGWDDPRQYNLQPGLPGFLGSVVGRYANRIANGTFHLNGETYQTPLNEKNITTLHGGDMGFNRLNFTLLEKSKRDITFGLISPDGDEGFPGTVKLKVKYSVNDHQEWHIDYEGVSDKDTIMMVSQHTYWNLDSFTTSDTVEDHVFWIPADEYIVTDGSLIPTGEFASVEGTALDFRTPKAMGKDLAKADQCGFDCIGYDNCWILSDPNIEDYQVSVYAPSTGIEVAVKTDQVAMQFYSCHGLDGTLPVKKTQKYKHSNAALSGYVEKYGCFVLETENYIDGINHPEWGNEHSGILRKGETYTQHTEYHFRVHNKQ